MAQSGSFKSFAEEVRAAFLKTKMKKKDFVAQLQAEGVTHRRAAIEAWANGKKPPARSAVPALAKVLVLPYSSAAEVEAAYPGLKWGAESKAACKGQPADSLDSLLEQMVPLHDRFDQLISEAVALTRAIFKYANGRHFLISTTCGVRPHIFDPEAHRDHVLNRFRAVHSGMLCALVTPTQQSLAQQARYSVGGMLDYPLFDELFEQLRNDFIRYLREQGESPDEAERIAYTRIGRLEWHEFPFTSAYWTTSLFGERHEDQSLTMRVILRTPYRQASSYLLFPGFNQPYHQSVMRYAEEVVKHHAAQQEARLVALAQHPGQHQPAELRRARWRREFLAALLDRMRGRPDAASFYQI